ncbi:MAG: hypothetical protein KF712_03210 [Akkermansiaceae bacterium]|nr:hypothetical protein [Akkermansiaceae bacterium]
MNQSPDWITGGDPIRTHWLAENELLHGNELRWHRLGEITDGPDSIAFEAGTAANGTTLALRAHARISSTARMLYAEAGWCADINSPLEIPLLSPSKWQEDWLSFLHGELTLQSLAGALGRAAETTGGCLKFTPTSPKARVSPFPKVPVLYIALVSATLGFFLGRFTSDKPSKAANPTSTISRSEQKSEASPKTYEPPSSPATRPPNPQSSHPIP